MLTVISNAGEGFARGLLIRRLETKSSTFFFFSHLLSGWRRCLWETTDKGPCNQDQLNLLTRKTRFAGRVRCASVPFLRDITIGTQMSRNFEKAGQTRLFCFASILLRFCPHVVSCYFGQVSVSTILGTQTRQASCDRFSCDRFSRDLS